MGQSGWRRQGGDPPAGGGGSWLVQGGVIEALAAPDQNGQDAGLLRRQLQSAGGNQAQPAAMLSDHCGEAGMSETFFHYGQHLFAGLGEDDATGVQPDASKARGEQISLPQHPQNGAIQTRQYTSDEHGSGGGVFRVGTSRGSLMQGAEADAAGGQNLVHRHYVQGD